MTAAVRMAAWTAAGRTAKREVVAVGTHWEVVARSEDCEMAAGLAGSEAAASVAPEAMKDPGVPTG